MRKRILKKSDVLREGYVKGLQAARKVIKESLSENESGGRKFIAKHVETTRARTEWNEGEVEDVSAWSYDGYLGDFEFGTPDQFLSFLKDKVSEGISEKSIWVDEDSGCGRIVVSYMGDEDGVELSPSEVEKWKSGELVAYDYFVDFNIWLVQKDTSDILTKEFGLNY